MTLFFSLIAFLAVVVLVVFVLTIPVGTKSLLFGVHQFVLHPYCVLRAWIELYGWPSWRELVCIVIHDWGYWGCPDMDGNRGIDHPLRGGDLAFKWFGIDCYWLVVLHSRHAARIYEKPPSKLCWADKLSIKYMPTWLYLILSNLSGEIAEYRRKSGLETDAKVCDWEWHEQVKAGMIEMAMEQNAEAMPYMKRQ